MKKSNFILYLLCLIMIALIIYIISNFNIIPKKSYKNSDFNIETYISKVDKDLDGVDDQTDILNSAKEYIKKKPKYKSKYYGTGYPNDEYGVCTDVVGFALLDSGYDLMNLVNEDIINHREDYNIEVVDKNIDFRRTQNLDVYFKHTAISLTTDVKDIANWQGGDIVVFTNHIGIVSDKRNSDGITYVIHHANPYQTSYEEDILTNSNNIIGHYRIS